MVMNTRNFLKSLALIAVAPQILIPRAPDAYRWKRGLGCHLWEINQNWVDAPYEVVFIDSDNFPSPLTVFLRDPVTHKIDFSIKPLRFARNPETGIFERVNPII